MRPTTINSPSTGAVSASGTRVCWSSALARPLNLHAYGEPSLPRLAAAYAFGIARNHPFVDGNKRTALVAAELFLGLNGWDLTATDVECVEVFLSLAAGELGEEELAAWINRKSKRRET